MAVDLYGHPIHFNSIAFGTEADECCSVLANLTVQEIIVLHKLHEDFVHPLITSLTLGVLNSAPI